MWQASPLFADVSSLSAVRAAIPGICLPSGFASGRDRSFSSRAAQAHPALPDAAAVWLRCSWSLSQKGLPGRTITVGLWRVTQIRAYGAKTQREFLRNHF